MTDSDYAYLVWLFIISNMVSNYIGIRWERYRNERRRIEKVGRNLRRL